MTKPLGGMAKRLVADQLISESALSQAGRNAEIEQSSLISYLVNNKLVPSLQIAAAAAQEFGVPLFDLDAFDFGKSRRQLVDIKLIKRHRILPLQKHAKQLFLAVSDPACLDALKEIEFHSGLKASIVVVEEDKLSTALQQAISAEEGIAYLTEIDELALDNFSIEQVDERDYTAEQSASDAKPIVRFVNKVLLDGIRARASDIHFEPYENLYRIRFRIDGVLQEKVQPPLSLAGRVAARLKIMSRMDISERRTPQDGRIRMRMSKSRAIDFRVNTLPTLWGEKIVLRILDPAKALMGIDALGFEDGQKSLYLHALQRMQGLILVTGATGSGKTATLYAGLNYINQPQRNISTAEDPVEINLEGINQVPLNNKMGLQFAHCLRAFLRQDPDVVMIGEIRDLETAEIAMKAAQTGHLVLSTLHTNSASETLTRLRQMGLPAFILASSISMIIAQGLLRRLCIQCKEKAQLSENILKEQGFSSINFNELRIHKAMGCGSCQDGYSGRVGIYEVVPITAALSQIIMDDGNALELEQQIQKEGFYRLRQSALIKVAQGLTSLDEANRLT